MEVGRDILQKDLFPVMLIDIFAALLDIGAAFPVFPLRRHPFAKIPNRLIAAGDERRHIHACVAFLQIVITELIGFFGRGPSVNGGPGSKRDGNRHKLSPLHDLVLRHPAKLLVETHIQMQRLLCVAFPDIIQQCLLFGICVMGTFFLLLLQRKLDLICGQTGADPGVQMIFTDDLFLVCPFAEHHGRNLDHAEEPCERKYGRMFFRDGTVGVSTVILMRFQCIHRVQCRGPDQKPCRRSGIFLFLFCQNTVEPCFRIIDGIVVPKDGREKYVMCIPDQGRKLVISTFSLHYIFMLLEYYKRTGDAGLLKQYRSDVDAILEYYDRHMGAQGLVENLGYWDFVDWQESWHDTQGRPGAAACGPSTILSLMYGKALLDGAEIYENTGRPGTAEEYRERQKHITDRIQALCWDEGRNMYREGPSYPEFTQHAQSWAVLNGMISGREAAELLHRTFEEPDVLQCGFSTCFELFRACERAGCYELTYSRMEQWIRLLEEHCMTCPETPVDSRSECHGWSALPIYELLHVIAGVRRETGHPENVVVWPHMEGLLSDLEGEIATEYGRIGFCYTYADGQIRGEISLPEGMNGTWIGTDGDSRELKPGTNVI